MYTDPGLHRLRAPARDAADLAQVLADPGIGGFTVTTVIDQPAQQVRLAVEDFLADRGTGALLLVYLSCHGLLDARRRLYFAATDTRKDRLGATGVEAAWVLDQLEHCRARRQVLRTGAADTDHDGHVSVDDAYAYVFDQVQAAGAAQTPQRWLYGAEGRILLARSPAGPAIVPAPLPESLQAGLDSPHPDIRIGAVTTLGAWVTGGDPARAATARRHIQEI